MATVTVITNLFLEPRDDRALYVWLGPDGRLEVGSFEAFQTRQPTANAAAAESDWDEAQGEALLLADQQGFPTVYVIRPE